MNAFDWALLVMSFTIGAVFIVQACKDLFQREGYPLQADIVIAAMLVFLFFLAACSTTRDRMAYAQGYHAGLELQLTDVFQLLEDLRDENDSLRAILNKGNQDDRTCAHNLQ